MVLAVCCAYAAHGENADTRQGVFNPSFRSLQIQLEGNPEAPPVINMNLPSDRLVISFDELSDDRRYLRYSLVHCDASWHPEGLVDSEFLDGFNEGVVENYAFSRATLVHYVHYTIAIPDGNMRITAPGNYLLRVYDENDPDRTLLQVRFGVSDFTAGVEAAVTSRTDIDSNLSHQQVSVNVDTRHMDVDDPFNDIRIVVTQNGRPDNEVLLSSPQRVAPDRIIYEHLRPMIFPGGNEYRRFETVSVTYPGMGVESISTDAPVYNMYLYTDFPRAGKDYLYDRTQQGRYLVRSTSAYDNDMEADYVMTHFALSMPQLEDKDVFIDGDMTDRRFDPGSRMVYNNATGCYEHSMLLKQGAYNYQYLAVPSGSRTGSTAEIEGDNYETVNEYTVKVYHRPRGTRFDRLVGVTVIRSGI